MKGECHEIKWMRQLLLKDLGAAILQRVLSAAVTVDKELVSSIGKGILVFAAVAPGDTEAEVDALAIKLLKIRMWDDDTGGRPEALYPPGLDVLLCRHPKSRSKSHDSSHENWKHNVQDINGEVLCVSQFTLLASTKKGTKPDFHGAMAGDRARELYQHFVRKVQEGYQSERVKDGVFQAMMEVSLVNDGPVTLEMSTGHRDNSGTEP